MNLQDAKAMFELQLELHARASGKRPNISQDELLEVQEWLKRHEGNLKDLLGEIQPQPTPLGESHLVAKDQPTEADD